MHERVLDRDLLEVEIDKLHMDIQRGQILHKKEVDIYKVKLDKSESETESFKFRLED